MSAQKQSVLWAIAGMLCILAALPDLLLPGGEYIGMTNVAFALCAGIFLLIVAWRKAGGRVFHDEPPSRPKRLSF